MQVGWGKSPPRVVHVVGRQGGGAACVFALWCMGTLALTSSIRSPQVAAADEEKGGEEETAGAEGALAYTQMILDALANAGSARGQPCSGTRRAEIEGLAALFRNMRALFCGRLWCSGTKHAFYCLLLPVFRSDLLPCFRHCGQPVLKATATPT